MGWFGHPILATTPDFFFFFFFIFLNNYIYFFLKKIKINGQNEVVLGWVGIVVFKPKTM
jgi:hypothetical protein